MPRPDAHWQLRAFRLGARVTWAMAVASLLYTATTWSQPHRSVLVAITLPAALDRGGGRRAPPRAAPGGGAGGPPPPAAAGRGRGAEAMMLGWNASHVAAALVT